MHIPFKEYLPPVNPPEYDEDYYVAQLPKEEESEEYGNKDNREMSCM